MKTQRFKLHFVDKTQSQFICSACGLTESADYNAAVNIARSTKIVTSTEQCEYHKKRSAEPPTQPDSRLKGEVAVAA